MPPVLDATIGSRSANSYLTHAEANDYFATRVPLATPWVTSGQEAALIMATRTLDALAQPFKTLFTVGTTPYYRIRRQWTGAAATQVQRLAWPRVQMFTYNNVPLDVEIDHIDAGIPGVVTTEEEHFLASGQKILIFDVDGGTPDINGPQTVLSVPSTTTFTFGVTVVTPGTGGKVTTIPQALKDATAELAGQLLLGDRTLDNDVMVQGIKSVRAGSVAVTFDTAGMTAQVIPQSVYDMLPVGWLTDELYEPALSAMFDIVSEI